MKAAWRAAFIDIPKDEGSIRRESRASLESNRYAGGCAEGWPWRARDKVPPVLPLAGHGARP
jgi:hypothetical protein